MELLRYWRREGRRHPLFFAQIEAAETIIFLSEARADFLQGINVPLDEPGEEAKAEGIRAFRRHACKMATGTGKTTVMGMIAAWSILNKVADRGDARFSDVVLVVCPNVTIRNRLEELRPQGGEASLYRSRDLVPSHLMPQLARGHVLVTNWHVFEPKSVQAAGQSAKVLRAGRRVRTRETIRIGARTTTARGTRYLTPEDLERQAATGLVTILEEHRDRQGHLKSVSVESFRYVESDTRLIGRVLGREIGGKRNLLVMNDEAHHAYRIRRTEPDEGEADLFGEADDGEAFYREATVWIDGLDRIHKARGINLCIDLSATPYYLGRVGQNANRPFPWVVSDFGLIDAIESGLVKIPQLAVRDTSGAPIPGYFNIWRWILPKLTPAERGGRRGSVKPEAVLKYAHVPMAMLGGLWDVLREEWGRREDEVRPPVFIIVCNDTALAKVVYRWLAEDKAPVGIPPARLDGFAQRGRSRPHHPGGHQGGARVRQRGGEVRPGPLDAPDPGHGWQDRLAAGRTGTAHPSGRFRGAGAEARTASPSAGPGRAVHRQRGDADRGMGLQHRHPHRGASPLHVAVALRAGGRPGAAALQLRGGGRRKARRGGREDLRRPVRDRPAEGESSERREAAPQDLAGAGGPREGPPGDPLSPRRGLHTGDPPPYKGRLGEHRAAASRPDGHPAGGGAQGGPAEQ